MLLFLSFLTGLTHGLGSDHLMAITAVASRGGSRRQVSLVGLRFGLGHMGILVLFTAAALVWNLEVSPRLERASEGLGGGILVVLGLWTLLEWLREVGYIHSHPHWHGPGGCHQHYHFHFGARHPHRHLHPHFSSVLGGLFALGGLRSLLLAAFPVLAADSLWSALGYIALFGLGILLSMTGYGLLLGRLIEDRGRPSWLILVVGVLSLGLGLYWIATA